MDRTGETFTHGDVNETPKEEDGDTDGHVSRLLAGYALGALDPHEMEQVARHVQRCVSCRAELAEYESVTGLLAYAAPPLQVPVRARAGLLSKLDAVGSTNADRLVMLPRPPRARRTTFSVFHSQRYLAFAAVPLVMVLAVVLVMGEIISEQQQELRTTQEEKNEAHRVLTSAGVDDPRFMTDFTTVPDTGGAALGRLFLDREANTAMIVARDLPALEDGQQYAVWFRMQEPLEYAHAGVLHVDDQGRTQLTLEPVDPITTYAALVITIESDADVASPAGPEVMTAGMLPENLQVVP